ncbi:DNA repair protein RadA, partial [Candidatus Uhrbacteria bacterium]|nr:DNA repair protein RadA [Candidatus Uhrbacteria bacterium]
MPAKTLAVYVCANCDAQSPKWAGQCLECGGWGTVALRTATAAETRQRPPVAPSPVTSFGDIKTFDLRRLSTGLGELDRVLGGGLVPGSVTLLGGEPGVGKSTLAMMVAAAMGRNGKPVLYVSGEESASQVKMRAVRLGAAAARGVQSDTRSLNAPVSPGTVSSPGDGLHFLGETDVDHVVATLEHEKPALAIIDSIQTLIAADIPAEAGAVSQVRGAAARLVAHAKEHNTPLLLIGHVTKDGHLAGPKTLEHLVDTVLSFEGERSHPLRALRSLKNRFGSTDETGIFAMSETGLEEIRNPSAYLLDERRPGVSGSAVSCIIEGSRPLLVEMQALVQKTSFGYPVRRATGFDNARLEMLIAVLGRRANIDLGQHDVYVNVVGGLKVREPAADLAVIVGLASAFRNAPLPDRMAVWGEIGLG